MNLPPAAPSIETHIAVTAELPEENRDLAVGRPDLPTPSLWQSRTTVTHKLTKRRAVVVRVDYGTNMFRAFYPDEGATGEDGKPAGRFSERTEWEHCHEWNVEVTFSPREIARQEAMRRLEEELKRVDPEDRDDAMLMLDDVDPVKALAKLTMMCRRGMFRMSAVAAQAVAAEKKAGK